MGIGSFKLPIGGKKNEIKFYPNPAVYDYIVTTNGDSATDGSGNSGSLRYCMTNCSTNDIIITADTLADTAGSGNIDIIVINSQLPVKNCSIYGNKKIITKPKNGSYFIFNSTLNIYSFNFDKIITSYPLVGSATNFFGCTFSNIYCSTANLFQGAVSLFYCEIRNAKTPFYINALTIENCNLINISCSYFNQVAINIKYSYINNCSTLSGGFGDIIKNCTIIDTPIAYNCIGTYENNVIINHSGLILFGPGNQSNFTCNFNHNTIVMLGINTRIFNIVGGRNITFNFKNNLIIAPQYTYIIYQSTPMTVVESGNIYMAVNTDALLPNSTISTSNDFTTIIINEISNNVDGIKRLYFKPKTNKAARLSTVLTDYNGKSRQDQTYIGAIEL